MQPTTIKITVQAAKESFWSILAIWATVLSAVATLAVAILTSIQSRIAFRQLEEATENRRLIVAPDILIEPHEKYNQNSSYEEFIKSTDIELMVNFMEKNNSLRRVFFSIGNSGKGNAYNLKFQNLNNIEFDSCNVGTVLKQQTQTVMISIYSEHVPYNKSTILISYENDYGETYQQKFELFLVQNNIPLINCLRINPLRAQLIKQKPKKDNPGSI
jgi:hypothetical protein